MSIVLQMVENHIDDVRDELHLAKQRALEMIGLQAEGYAQFYAPVDTGRLQSSISHRVIDDNSVAIGTNVEYAVYQEMGTSKIPPHPYLKPACVNFMDEYREIVKTCLKGG